MATFPATPLPRRTEEDVLDRAATTQEYDGVIRHARNRTGFSIRRTRLAYEFLPPSQFEILRDFFDARRAGADRFDFTHPITAATYKGRFVEDRLAWRVTKTASGPAYALELTVEEAP